MTWFNDNREASGIMERLGKQSFLLDTLCRATRTFPSFRGRWRLMRWLKKQDAKFLPYGEVEIFTPWRQKINVDPYDFIGRHIFVEGVYEQECMDVLKRYLRPGGNFIDIGANIGYFSLYAAFLIGDAGHVYAFEASPGTFERLKKNIGINRLSNITPYSAAVSDKSGTIVFHEAARMNRGLSSMRPLGMYGSSSFTVECLTIDSIMDILPAISLVKIDVEGAEFHVLAGMKKLIARDRPGIILELSDIFLKETGSSAGEVCRFLGETGYNLYRTENHRPLDWKSPPTEQCNVLALHPSHRE